MATDTLPEPPKPDAPDHIEFTEAISAAASKFESALLDEIKEMSGAAASVDQSFRSVSNSFVEVRSGASSAPVKADMQVLENRWNTYHTMFTNLVWRSREVAGKAQAAADDFARDFIVFLCDDTESLESKKDEIKNYIEELDRDAKSAETVSQGFLDLRHDLIRFRGDWEELCEKYDIKGKVEKVEGLKAQLDQLDQAKFNINVKITGILTKLAVSETFDNVFSLFRVVTPRFWLSVVKEIPSFHSAVSERVAVSSSYAETFAQYVVAQRGLEEVQVLPYALDKAKDDITNVCDKIGSFAKIWAIIRADLQQISNKLNYAVNSGREKPFKARLTTTAKLYALLGKALYQYQISVTSEHPIFTTEKD